MRVKNLLFGFLGVLALSACSSENDGLDNGGSNAKGESRFMSVEISSPLTRANGYEEGADVENKIASLRFYFFDKDGNAVTVNSASGVNYVNATSIVEDGKDMDNVELKLKATVVINTQNGDNANVNSILAVANYENASLGTSSLGLNALKEKVAAYTASTDNNFLMTSSTYAGADGPTCVAAVKPENLCSSEAAALANPVRIYIERLVAKTRLNTAWTNAMSTVDATLDGTPYKAVLLKTSAGENIMSGGKQVYVIFKGWNLTGTADKSYLLKNINTPAAWTLGGWEWNNSGLNRSFWAMNPSGLTLGHVSYAQANLALGADSKAYCYENAADNFSDGTKTAYEPASAISNRTQAIMAAVLVTVENGVATVLDLATWGGVTTTEDGVKALMLNQIASEIFYETTAEGASSRTFLPISSNMVKFVTATDAGLANSSTEESKRYLCYLQVADGYTSTLFYKSSVKNATDDAGILASKYADTDAVNTVLETVPGAKVWKSGMTYYYTDLKHLGNTATTGLYGVVRNHVYDVKLNTVYGLGTPVYKPEEVIIPQKPKDDDTFIAAQIDVLSWRVVNNNVDLTW